MSLRINIRSLVLGACLVTTQGQAQTGVHQFIDLDYEIDHVVEDCPNAVEFRSFVTKELGYDPYRSGSDLGLRVRVRSTANGLEGNFDWTQNSVNHIGERRFFGRLTECHKMMASMGFAVAVQLQLMATEPMTDSAESGKARGSDAPTEPPTSDPGTNRAAVQQSAVTLNPKSFTTNSAHKPTRTDWALFAGAGPAFGIGLAPAPVVQGRTFFDIRHQWVGFELGGEMTVPVTKRYAPNGGFRDQLRLGTVAACAWFKQLAICGVAKLGRIQVEGIDLDVPASPKGFLAQTGPRLVYAIDLGDHLIFLGHVETMGLLTSWKVETNEIPVWTMPRFSSVVGIDVAVRF